MFDKTTSRYGKVAMALAAQWGLRWTLPRPAADLEQGVEP